MDVWHRRAYIAFEASGPACGAYARYHLKMGDGAAKIWQGDQKRDVRFTSNALHTLKLRNISKADVLHALSEGFVSQIDDKTGHTVLRMGDVRIVTQSDASSVTVLTAMQRVNRGLTP